MRVRWANEKNIIKEIRAIKERMETERIRSDGLQREGNLEKVAEIRYAILPSLEKDLKASQKKLSQLQKDRPLLREEVSDEDIALVVSTWTGIPVTKMLEGEIQKLVKMEDRLAVRVVGQEEAIRAVSAAVRRARASLQDPNRPLGSFIFMGPTGVGKTELARALAEFLFDSDQAMVRVDMSEYMEKHAVSRLIGAPPGYVGYEEGGFLTEAVRRKPYSVVLFDEIEKAHQDVFNVLLQILDDGRLTDSHGRVVSFKNTVIIMTSNVGSQFLQEFSEKLKERGTDVQPVSDKGKRPASEPAGQEETELRSRVMDALRAQFRPEFLNRIDDIILFHNLSLADIKKIVDIQLAALRKRLAERKMTLELAEPAREALAKEGFDPVYGARPLKRLIQKRIQDPLALSLLQGQYKDGDTIEVKLGKKGEFEFRG